MEKQKIKKVKITSEYITLGQLLKFCDLIYSGSEAKEYILNNNIIFKDIKVEQRGKKLYPGDQISINNTLFFEITK